MTEKQYPVSLSYVEIMASEGNSPTKVLANADKEADVSFAYESDHFGPEAGPALTAENMDLLHEQALEMAERDGLEVLRSIFDSMALNGRITMDQLPFVLVGAEIQATAKEIDEAIEEFLPDADDADALLDFDQVQTLYQQLVHIAAELLPLDAVALNSDASKPTCWRRLWDWVKLKRQQRKLKQTAYEKHMKPTTRLLLLILFTSVIISLAVVLFAVLTIWNHSENTMVTHIQRDAQLMKEGLHLFGYAHPFGNYDKNLKRLASLLGIVVSQLGYENTRTTLKANLAYQQLLLSKLLDGWYSHDSLSTVSTLVTLVKAWADRMLEFTTVDELVRIVNKINPRMPEGHEILLARWNATTQRIDFLTEFRFRSMCIGVCASNQATGSTATKKALANQTGSLFGFDYRPKPVIAGYTPLPQVALALVYNVRQTTFRTEFVQPVVEVVDSINSRTAATNVSGSDSNRRQNSQEIVLAHAEGNATAIVTALRLCDAKCLQAVNIDATLIANAVNGSSGTKETADFHGEPILLAYGPMMNSGFGMEVKIAQEEFLDTLWYGLGTSFDFVNSGMDGTKEVQFAAFKKTSSSANAASGMRVYTNYRFAEDCEGHCGSVSNSSVFLHQALDDCTEGVMEGLDYRGEMVTAGYACIPAMHAAIAFKVDHAQILREGAAMAGVIATFQNNVRYANKSTEVVVAKKKAGVAMAESARDYDRITVLKHRNDCPNMTCTGPSTQMVRAVNRQSGFIRGPDYRNVEVFGAYIYLDSLDVGMVVKIDASEAQKSTFTLAGILVGCTGSAVLLSMLVLAALANVLLKSMDRAWDEGKKAVEREKQAFRSVIEAMYPAQVAKRMLAGETQIVYNVPTATVFFSDIYEFTTASNAVSPQELIQFMGYTFGVMDQIADYYHIHKVKTIGDAYLAVAGLPGLECKNGNSTLDMLLFASCCAQVFSNKYLHPEEAAILDVVVKTVLGKRKVARVDDGPQVILAHAPKRPSQIGYGDPNDAFNAAMEVRDNGSSAVHCIMRYGVSAGPITAGVLQGKTPLFDIWGKTVNLASRMESTGQAGRIQVSESVYLTVVSLKGQPFTFDARHKVFCKGFGSISAYFVSTCSVSPPKELLNPMNIEPDLGHFYFDNPVPNYQVRSKNGGSSKVDSSHRSSSVGPESEKSSVISGPRVRADAHLYR